MKKKKRKILERKKWGRGLGGGWGGGGGVMGGISWNFVNSSGYSAKVKLNFCAAGGQR